MDTKTPSLDEKGSQAGRSTPESPIDIASAESQVTSSKPKEWLSRFASWGVEMRGITPVPLEERTDLRFINVFFVWFTMSTNLLPFVSPSPIHPSFMY